MSDMEILGIILVVLVGIIGIVYLVAFFVYVDTYRTRKRKLKIQFNQKPLKEFETYKYVFLERDGKIFFTIYNDEKNSFIEPKEIKSMRIEYAPASYKTTTSREILSGRPKSYTSASSYRIYFHLFFPDDKEYQFSITGDKYTLYSVEDLQEKFGIRALSQS